MMHSEKKSHLGKCIFVYCKIFYLMLSSSKKLNFFIKKFQNERKYTSWDGIFFLNASFKRVYSTLSNDVFRKQIPSQKVYFHLWCMSLRSLFLFFEKIKKWNFKFKLRRIPLIKSCQDYITWKHITRICVQCQQNYM